MVTDTAADGMPFVTTTRLAAPRPMVDGMSNCADTTVDPVATPPFQLCVLQYTTLPVESVMRTMGKFVEAWLSSP